MIKNILVPLDGTPLAEAALPIATTIASRARASVTLVRAARYSSLLSDVAGQQYRVIAEAEEYLSQLTDRLSEQGLSVQAGVPFGGSPAKWIVEESEIRHIDLIVMATHDREGADRWLHGSVAESVVHRSTVPVMLIRAAPAAAQPFDISQPVLIVPVDGSALADAALPFAAELAQATGARIVLTAILPKPGQLIAGQGGAIVAYTASQDAELEAEAHGYLSAAMGRLGIDATRVQAVVRYGDAATEISMLADESGAAAVVMATHGRTGVVRSVLGSVAGGVLHLTARPVVLIHPTRLAAVEQPVSQLAAVPSLS